MVKCRHHHSNLFLMNKEDWSVWKFMLRTRLDSEGMLGIIEGTAVCPVEPAAEIEKWKKLNTRAMGCLCRSLGMKFAIHIVDCATAASAWTTLKSVFETTDPTFAHLLQQKFFDYKYTPNVEISEYIRKLKRIAVDCRNAVCVIDDSQIITKFCMDYYVRMNRLFFRLRVVLQVKRRLKT